MRISLEQNPRQAIMLARLACAAFGLTMMLWGLAPAFVHRIATGTPPPFAVIGVGSLSLLIGGTSWGLFVLIGQGVRWALWAAFWLSLTLLTTAIGFWLFSGAQFTSLFLLVMTASLFSTSWMALHSRARNADRLDDEEEEEDLLAQLRQS